MQNIFHGNIIPPQTNFGGGLLDKNPAISVIVPIYNVEQYIKFCVDSILAQTFKDFEVILVDDASPDNSYALCQKLYSENDKVKFVRHEKNQGLGAARNTGIKHALGKYVTFVDSDDFILPDALEKFYNAAEKSNAEVVQAAGRYELTQDEPFPIRQENLKLEVDRYNREGFLTNDLPRRLSTHLEFTVTASMAWLCLCRKDFLDKNKIRFLPVISEDEPFHFALLFYAERYYILPQATYVYRRRSGSIMKSKPMDRIAKAIKWTFATTAYVKKLLKHIPQFNGFEQWRDNILSMFYKKLYDGHTNFYYEDLKVSPEVNATVSKTLAPFFGNKESFVRFFFNAYNLHRRQAEILFQRLQALLNQNQRLSALPALLTREQPNMLRIMDALRTNNKRIFVMGTPSHGNLGDQAIVAGELLTLKNFFPEHAVIDIPYDYLTGELGELFWGLGFDKLVRDTGIIFMYGGGNLGNLWLNEEELRRKLIEKFPTNKIVIFPQSIHFSNDDAGSKERDISARIYNAHPDLHLMTRDQNSFGLAQKIFTNVHNYLLPDAVTVMHGIMDNVDVKREGVLFVLRSDKEKVRDDRKIQMLQVAFDKAHIPYSVTDTIIADRVNAFNREPKLLEIFARIRKSKLVITDRFHGVIFSFITRTPVLAFKSFDTKISSGIKWFKDLPSVFYAEEQDLTGIENFIKRALSTEAPFPEMNPAVKLSTFAAFANVLNQIVNTPAVKSVNHNTPPPVYLRQLTIGLRRSLRWRYRCLFATSDVITATCLNVPNRIKVFSLK